MTTRRLVAPLVPLVVVLGCGGGESDDDSTIDPGGPADEVGSDSSSSGSDSDSTSSDSTDSGEFTFGAAQTSNVFAFDDLQLGDLDADGCADLVLAGSGAPPRLNLYAGACDGTFPGPAIPHEIFDYDAFVLGDLDGDGRLDVITRGSGMPARLETYLSGPGFALGPATTSEVWNYDSLWSIDVDGDGRADVITHQLAGFPPTLFTWSGPGDGSLSELASSEVIGFDVAGVGQLDQADPEGRGDLLIAGQSLGTQVSRWTGQLDGGLVQSGPTQSLASLGALGLALGDLDGDGRSDLLADVPGNDWIVQLHANLGASFADDPQLVPGVGYWALRSADLDGDGRDDLILAPTGQPPRVTTWIAGP